tara:strand:+ start:430 stop:648 length:219 start_codon:yes stop_codon:yes gene_type:complete
VSNYAAFYLEGIWGPKLPTHLLWKGPILIIDEYVLPLDFYLAIVIHKNKCNKYILDKKGVRFYLRQFGKNGF